MVMSKLKMFDVEYELPFIRAIYWDNVSAFNIEEAKAKFLASHPSANIRAISEIAGMN